jgi:hypothetical protein
MLRYYQDYPAAKLAALDAASAGPPQGTIINVNWANLPASALRRMCVGAGERGAACGACG